MSDLSPEMEEGKKYEMQFNDYADGGTVSGKVGYKAGSRE